MKKNQKRVIDGETIRKALNNELPQGELEEIASFGSPYEKGDYYDFQLLCAQIHKCVKGKISFDELLTWLALLLRCILNNDITDEALRHEYDNLADLLEEFLSEYDREFDFDRQSKRYKRFFFREPLANIRWINHKIENLKQGQKTDFTTNGVITYVSFASPLNEEEEPFCKVCVVDKVRKRINHLYALDIDYREDVNYTFLDEDEFDHLTKTYSDGYETDPAMPVNYAVMKTKQSK